MTEADGPAGVLTYEAGLLHRFVFDNIDAATAVTRIAGRCVGWAMSPTLFALLECVNGRVVAEGNGGLPDDTYELILFTSSTELRWSKRPDGGKGALITENELTVSDARTLTSGYDAIVDGTAGLLWGETSGRPTATSGWSRLSTTRLGGFDVPVKDVRPKSRVALMQREYLGRNDSGVASVVERRYTGFHVVSALGNDGR